MSGTKVHPVYSGIARSRLERLKVGRKYGKYDFGRFDQLTGSSYYLGKGCIGDMEVACNFLFTKSQWGILTPAQNPGGVVYLDLVFTEPPDCRLKGATVQLTLDEEDEDLRKHFASGKPPPKPRVPVQITEHGPQQLHGEMREAMKATRNMFAPQINAAGFGGIGGVGRESEQQELKRSNWRFSSQSLPNHLGRPTILRWDLNENELDRQPDHNNRFHTAFAFEHDGQPFFMQVEVGGHLESTTSHLKHKVKQRFKRFKFPAEPQSATTLVNFGGRENPYKTPLDELATSIPLEMLLANMKQVPRVPGMQTGPKLLYQVSAETEEAMMVEEEAVDVSDEQIEQPYMTNVLTPGEMAQLRAEAMSVLSLGQSSSRNILQTEVAEQPFQSDRSGVPEARDDNKVPGRNHAHADNALAQDEQDARAAPDDSVTRPPANYEKIEKLLQEAGLSPLVQLIILWLMSFGMRWAQLEKRKLLSTTTTTD